MKKVITTVGTSIIDNYLREKEDIFTHYKALKDKPHKEWDSQQERISPIKSSILSWSKKQKEASAEIKSLVKIREYIKDDMEVNLIATDSVISRLAAEIICEWFSDTEHIEHIKVHFNPARDVILHLQVYDYSSLIKEGLPNLINRINHLAGVETDSAGYFENIIFNISGGYKAFIPYLTIIATVNKCKLVYIYEDTDSLIWIPPLPVKIDFDIFEKYSYEIAWLDEGIKNYQDEKSKHFKEFSAIEEKGLVEIADNLALLSPIGKIFYERFKNKFFLFYAPDDVYSQIEKQPDIMRILKTKFRYKDLRDSKTEIKGNHYVYDDGDNDNRIYYFEENGNCYIYKTFQSEEAASRFINQTIDKDKIIQESKLRKLEV